MNIVIIGGAGFIGHHMALGMVAKNNVTVIDSLSVNNYYSLRADRTSPADSVLITEHRLNLLNVVEIPVIRIDAADYNQLSPALLALEPDVIIHLAAVAHVDRSNKDPKRTFDNSLITLQNTLDVARNLPKPPHVVWFSSSTAYGNTEGRTVMETTPLNPIGIYARMKAAGEQMVAGYRDTFGIDTTIVRPSALYGPRCISGRVTQKFMEQAFAGQSISIFGDGSILSDFTYIDDLVAGTRSIINKRQTSAGETFNITGGHGRSLQELADIVVEKTGAEVLYLPDDPEKPRRGTLSVQKAENLLGWTPKFTLETGMMQYMGWYQTFLDRNSRDVA